MIMLVLLVIPMLVAVVSFIALPGITWKEFAIQVVAQVIVAGISAAFVSCSSMGDVEIWNGVVTSKEESTVSCEHSYQCHCRPECHEECSSNTKSTSCHEECTTVCDTCYEHDHDFDWNVHDSNGETFTITRVDRQGVNEPERWRDVRIGEPTATAHSFKNYIKAAPDTLFRHQGLVEQFKPHLPAYPGNIVDYYRLDRVLLINGARLEDPHAWTNDLSALDGELGKSSQMNGIIVITRDLPHEYAFALEQAWIGGKKNDVILVLGTDGAGTLTWAHVIAWSLDPLFQVKLRDDVMAIGGLDRAQIVSTMRADVAKYFKRKPMHDFAYLKASVVPTTTQWIVALVVGLLVAVGLAYFFNQEDVFDEETRTRKVRFS